MALLKDIIDSEELIAIEINILSTLHFDIEYISCGDVVTVLNQLYPSYEGGNVMKIYDLVNCVMRLLQLSSYFMKYKPSEIGCASFIVVRKLTQYTRIQIIDRIYDNVRNNSASPEQISLLENKENFLSNWNDQSIRLFGKEDNYLSLEDDIVTYYNYMKSNDQPLLCYKIKDYLVSSLK